MTKGRRRKENFEKREKSKRLHFFVNRRALLQRVLLLVLLSIPDRRTTTGTRQTF